MAKKDKQCYSPKSWETIADSKTYVRVYLTMMKSPAYKVLSHHARELYRLIKAESRGTNIAICPYDNIISYGGFRRNSIPRYIKELELMGFIKCESGGLYRTPNKYTFVDGWKDINEKQAEEKKAILKSEYSKSK